MPGLKDKVKRAYLLADKSRCELAFIHKVEDKIFIKGWGALDPRNIIRGLSEDELVISVPGNAPDEIDTVVVLKIKGKVKT